MSAAWATADVLVRCQWNQCEDERDVVASRAKVDNAATDITALPTLAVSGLEELLESFVTRAVTTMGCSFADGAGSLSVTGTAGDIVGNVVGRDEGRAARIEAVGSILGVKLDGLLLKVSDELGMEQRFGIVERNRLATATRWVHRLVDHGIFEQYGQTVHTVVVAARSLENVEPRELLGTSHARNWGWVVVVAMALFVVIVVERCFSSVENKLLVGIIIGQSEGSANPGLLSEDRLFSRR